jgi:putative ABC transport system permease protein
LTSLLRREVGRISDDVAVSEFTRLDARIEAALAPARFTLTAITLFALMTLVLATVGLYGVISYTSSQRTREIGVRLAFGAARSSIVRLVVIQGMALTALGLAIGLAGSLVVTGALEDLLYGVTANDPTTYLGLTLGVAAIAFVACYLPARKASKADPTSALRFE